MNTNFRGIGVPRGFKVIYEHKYAPGLEALANAPLLSRGANTTACEEAHRATPTNSRNETLPAISVMTISPVF